MTQPVLLTALQYRFDFRDAAYCAPVDAAGLVLPATHKHGRPAAAALPLPPCRCRPAAATLPLPLCPPPCHHQPHDCTCQVLNPKDVAKNCGAVGKQCPCKFVDGIDAAHGPLPA